MPSGERNLLQSQRGACAARACVRAMLAVLHVCMPRRENMCVDIVGAAPSPGGESPKGPRT